MNKDMNRTPRNPGRGPGRGGRPQRGPGAMMPGEKARDFGGTMKKLLGYLKPYRFRLVVVFLFAIVSTIFSIISPTILGDATDIIVQGLMKGSIDYGRLLEIVALLLGLYGLSFGFSFAQGFIMARLSQQVTYTFREKLSEKMDKLPVRFFDSMTTGEFQSRVTNDVETINQSLSQSITQTITAIVTLVGILVMMIRISLLMTLVAVVVLPVSMLVIRLVVNHSQGYFRDQQRYLGSVNAHVEEMYTGHTVVKLFNREDESIRAFDEYNEKLYESGWKSQFFSGVMMPATRLIGNIGYAAVCVLGGYLAIHGRVSIGDIQAFIQYVNSFNQPLQQVANVANLLQSTAAAAERIFEIIDRDEEPEAYDPGEERQYTSPRKARRRKADLAGVKGAEREPAPAARGVPGGEGHVVFDHVSFGYREDEPVIHDFSYDCPPGSMIAIVGPTGAGKTTLVKLLMRFYELNGGRILVNGRDITSMSRSELRDEFGMVLQDTWLFSGTIRENLKYGAPDASDEQMIRAAKAARIHHYIMTQPKGYDTMINEDTDNVSQGQKQLLTIARAMLADNPVLILDEATSSVDTRTERLIQEAMTELMKGRTSFVIAHRLSTIRDADHILVMNHGDIVGQGTHDELMAEGGFYADLYNSQFTENQEQGRQPEEQKI